jgi:muramoyltetrapeptide carboxypeptidase
MTTLIKGKCLTPGDTIGVIAFGSPAKPELFKQGVCELEARGYKIQCPLDPCCEDINLEHGFASGTTKARIQALNQLLKDDSVTGIIAVRGGYGTLGLLPYLDFNQFKRYPKLIVGYSDITVLLLAISAFSGLATIHGPTIANEFSDAKLSLDAKASVDGLLTMLSNPNFTAKHTCEILRRAEASGKIIAGNLTMLLTLLGTPWDFSYDGAILVLEDVNEAPYRVHRALTQLKLAGKLESLAGVVFGRFAYNHEGDKSVITVNDMLKKSVRDIFLGSNYPILMGLEFGHNGKNIALPIGCRARIVGNDFIVEESPVC